ncbi:DUF2157 domain-containing protein [Pectobacterium brasiliense]|uniref:hypothetical protein n=1 Tax=Pectobacterium brasiliense TaxID=180957 RepID=UPI0004E61499|nr:hypothetical protein [Pectobacterium brasiliense]KFF71773.1 hypothetical protein IW01_07495 [Pectobacterium brasiliense]MBN3114383.1 DUF2157 domain-containing protein [Pectobacterium brasiliense]
MSKFRDINVKGSDNSNNNNVNQKNSGGNNVQNTTIVNKTTNNNYNNMSNGQDPSGIGVIVIAGAIGLLFIIWFLFTNLEKIYSVLKIVSITSPLLAALAVIILAFRDEVVKNDITRAVLSLVLGGTIFFLNEFFKTQAPQDIIVLSYRANSVWDFWNGLNEHGKNISISMLVSSILIALSAIINHFISIRQFLYSLSDPAMTGICFSVFKMTDFFRIRVSGTIIIIFAIFTLFALQGYIFNFKFS